jgi:beta-glucanase (GH16 family)
LRIRVAHSCHSQSSLWWLVSFLNKLSGEGLFDERPRTQTSLGRFVLCGPAIICRFPNFRSLGVLKPLSVCKAAILLLSLFCMWQPTAHGQTRQAVKASAASATKAPTFSDTFSGGALDVTKWFIDTGRAPGNIPGQNDGALSTDHVDCSTGMLRLTLTQSVSGPLATSVGAEIRSKQLFSYGTYSWFARAASTSATPHGAGAAVSGTVTDLFNFINDSESEIDFEYQGQTPSTLEMTNFSTVSKSQNTTTAIPAADSSFHEYQYVWRVGRIDFYVDRALVSTHTENVPSAPAAVLINLWGTNSTSFGGMATDGLTRYLYVSSFSYTPLP